MAVKTHPRTLPRGRAALARVAARARPFVDVSTVAAVLQVDSKRAAKQLARWNEQGFVRRIRRGIYAIVPAAAAMQENIVMDPWVLVPTLFREAYVAGWSAAEHWDLTEQVFTTLRVCTTDAIKRTDIEVSGVSLRARHIPASQWFATAATWHEGTRVLVSDLQKTILDMFIDPELGGGIQHVAHCFREYLRRSDADVSTLVVYATKADYAPAFKRMGFVCEVVGGPARLRDECLRHVTLGLANLDSAIVSPRVSKRWQLRLPRAWEKVLSDG